MKTHIRIIVYIVSFLTGIQLLVLCQFHYSCHREFVATANSAEVEQRYGKFDYINVVTGDNGEYKWSTAYYIIIPESHGIFGDQPAVVCEMHFFPQSRTTFVIQRCWTDDLR